MAQPNHLEWIPKVLATCNKIKRNKWDAEIESGEYTSLLQGKFSLFCFFFSVAYENFGNLLSQVRKSRNSLEFYFTITPVL